MGKTASNLFEYVNKGDEVAILGKLVRTLIKTVMTRRELLPSKIDDWLLVLGFCAGCLAALDDDDEFPFDGITA